MQETISTLPHESLTWHRAKKSDPRITVLLAEDHAVVREGLKVLLAAEPDIHVIAEVEAGPQAVRLAEKMKPDVIVMDFSMPLPNGLETARQIRAAAPSAKLLVLSAHSDEAYVEQMVAIGARGYLIKQISFLILSKAIRQVHRGNLFFSPSNESHFREHSWKAHGPVGAARSTPLPLSLREGEVLHLIAEGKANKQIADVLDISIKTVEKHRQHLMGKLDIHDTAGLTRYSIVAGMIENSVQLSGM